MSWPFEKNTPNQQSTNALRAAGRDQSTSGETVVENPVAVTPVTNETLPARLRVLAVDENAYLRPAFVGSEMMQVFSPLLGRVLGAGIGDAAWDHAASRLNEFAPAAQNYSPFPDDYAEPAAAVQAQAECPANGHACRDWPRCEHQAAIESAAAPSVVSEAEVTIPVKDLAFISDGYAHALEGKGIRLAAPLPFVEPAPSHALEPAAGQGAPTWLLTYEDPERGHALYHDETEARTAYATANLNWACTLWTVAPDVQGDSWKGWSPRWVEFVERFEDMSPDGRLRLQRQQDGDVIVTVLAGGDSAPMYASVEFCAPMTGGGYSENTWKALIDLAAAMQKDEDERKQHRELPKG